MGVKSNFSALLSTVAISSSTFLVESPACSEGVVVEVGAFRIGIISVAAYLKKSSSLTCRNGMEAEKNVTVSTFISLRVLGK